MDRDDIISAVARTLFLSAYADGVEAGEIAGTMARGGEDWDDVAPREYEHRHVCPSEVNDPPPSEWRPGPGDLDELVQALRARGYLVRYNPAHGGANVILDEQRIAFVHVETREVPDPDALKEATRIVDAFDAYDGDNRISGGDCGREGERPCEIASRVHAELTGTDRFAHCLAMQALGHGVGLSDDLPPGEKLPGWIRASVPHSDFGYFDLSPERYPAPAVEKGPEDPAERVAAVLDGPTVALADDVLADAAVGARVRGGETVAQWRDAVKDPPAEYETVLAFVPGEGVYAGFLGRTWMALTVREAGELHGVTHWAPLPTGPEVKP